MDLRDLNIQPIRAQKPRARVSVFMDALALQCRQFEHQLKKTEGYHILYAGSFGVMRARSITSGEADCLCITVLDAEGHKSEIIAPIEQCSFLLSIVSLKPNEKREKVILGFAEKEPGEAR